MRFAKMISAVDAHTEGEPARVVVGGVPPIPGVTFHEKWLWARQNLDELRRLRAEERTRRLPDVPPNITLPTASTAIIFVGKPCCRTYSAQPRNVPQVLVAHKSRSTFSPIIATISSIVW